MIYFMLTFFSGGTSLEAVGSRALRAAWGVGLVGLGHVAAGLAVAVGLQACAAVICVVFRAASGFRVGWRTTGFNFCV